MAKTKKEQGWQNMPAKGAYTLNKSVIVAEKPAALKRKEDKEKQEKLRKIKEEGGIKPFPAAYNGGKPRRINDGGIIRLKRRNEKS